MHPVTRQQRRRLDWLDEARRLDWQGPVNTACLALLVHGPLDLAVLDATCRHVVTRHEVLRSFSYRDLAGQWRDVYLDPPPLPHR